MSDSESPGLFSARLCHGCATPFRYVRTATSTFIRYTLPPQPERERGLFSPASPHDAG